MAVSVEEAAEVVELVDNNYLKISFWTATKTYRGTKIMLIMVLLAIFTMCSIFILDIIFPNFPGSGSGSPIVPILILLFFSLIIWLSFKSIRKEWPMCKNHNERLVIVNKENLDNSVLISFECPKKDVKIKMLSPRPTSKYRPRSRFGIRAPSSVVGR